MATKLQQTFVMIKPDGVQRGLVGEILGRLERRGYRLVAMKLLQVTESLAAEHYAEHLGKPFYPGLLQYITSGPVVAMVWEGKDIVAAVRQMLGATNPTEAAAGTVRGDLAQDIGRNVIHGSDSPASAAREIGVYFAAEQLLNYPQLAASWLFE